MKCRMYLAASALLVLGISQLCTAQTFKPQPFSADMVDKDNTGTRLVGRYYVSPPNYRFDVDISGHKLSSIKNGNTIYTVMHDRRTYMTLPPEKTKLFIRQARWATGDVDLNNPCLLGQQRPASCKKVGTEMVNRRVCDKYEGISRDGKVIGTIWIDEKLHFPVKGVLADGEHVDLTNISEDRPDASLFQPPAGYRKVPFR